MNTNQLGTLFRSYDVKRFHTVPTIREQTVGDHTARVLALVLYFTENKPRLNLVRAVVEHDGLESLTGDIPATTKWLGNFGEVIHKLEEKINEEVKFGAYALLTEEDKLVLKVADMTELCCRASAEVLMGNKFMEVVFQNGSAYLGNLREKMPSGIWDKLNELLGHSGAKPAGTPAPAPNVQPVPAHPDHPK